MSCSLVARILRTMRPTPAAVVEEPRRTFTKSHIVMNTVSSMTGYALADGVTPAGVVTVECRSVNSRFLDLSLRLDEALRFIEPKIRETVQKRIGRGKMEVRIGLRPNESSMPDGINRPALERLLALQCAVLETAHDARELSVAEILATPGIAVEPASDRDALAAAVLEILSRALDAFEAARRREGAALANVIRGYCDQMEATVAEVRGAIPRIIEHIEGKLTERLEAALSQALSEKSTLDAAEISDRIRQEVTLYAIRLDVDEEMNRLITHISEVRRMLEKGGAVGRRLDFMAQEMNREANTLGSKAAAIEMTNASLALKIVIEQIREQIQNLE